MRHLPINANHLNVTLSLVILSQNSLMWQSDIMAKKALVLIESFMFFNF